MANKETYKGIYAMHKYWGKKPFNEISAFIGRYTDEGDTVMDSFCGSGVTMVEALKANRKCIGVDLNPIAVKLAKVSVTAVDSDELNAIFDAMKKKLKPVIDSLYTYTENGEKTVATHIVWKNEIPTEVWYTGSDGKKKIRAGTKADITMAENPAIEAKWYPTSVMRRNSRINIGKSQTVADLFTKRALVCLSLILDEINKIQNENIRDVFLLTFTGALSQASKLVFVIRKRGKNKESKAEVGSWVIGYWVPEEHFEINVWNCFENRFGRIMKGKKEIYDLFSSKPDNFSAGNFSVINGSATDLPVADESVDYVFTDPPHANRILYMEQSLMWNAWLRLDEKLDWENEIIISGAEGRENKNAENFNKLLEKAFSEIKRVLKRDKYFSVSFNCLDDKTWICLLNMIIGLGFELSDTVPLEYYATSVVQDNRKNALKTDFVLTFRNMHNPETREIVFEENDDLLREKISALIAAHPDYEVYNIINSLFEETIRKGYIFRISHIVKVCDELMN